MVAVHVPCSSKKMGIEEAFGKLAGLCAHEVRMTVLWMGGVLKQACRAVRP